MIGREFDELLLAPLAGLDEEPLLASLEEALALRIIEETGSPAEYRFTHALMRETLLGELSASRRVRLHARIAETLERLAGETSAERISELAAHYTESAVLGREHAVKAAHYLRLAGEQAQSQLAWDEAERLYERCLDLVTAHEDRLDQDEAALWLELGLSRLAGGLWDEAESLERAFSRWPEADSPGLARSLLRVFAIWPLPPMVRRFMATLDRAVAALGPAPLPETCSLLAWKASAHPGNDGDAVAARAHEIAQALGLEGSSVPLPLRVRPARAAMQAGRLLEALATFEQLEAESPDLAGAGSIALLQFLAGNLGRAEEAARRQVELHRERGRTRSEQLNLCRLAAIEWRRGRTDAADRLVDGLPVHRIWVFAPWHAEQALQRGDIERALAELPDLRTAPRQMPWVHAGWLAIRCRVLWHAGQPDAARAAFGEWQPVYDRLRYEFILETEALQGLDDVLSDLAGELQL